MVSPQLFSEDSVLAVCVVFDTRMGALLRHLRVTRDLFSAIKVSVLFNKYGFFRQTIQGRMFSAVTMRRKDTHDEKTSPDKSKGTFNSICWQQCK